jgi:hypothetical protein
VKRKRALLGSNPPRNSRWKLTAMSHEADVRVHVGLMRYETSVIAVDFGCLQTHLAAALSSCPGVGSPITFRMLGTRTPKRETVKAGAVARLISEEMLVMKVLLGAALAAMVLSTGAAFAGTGDGNGQRQPVYADAAGGNGRATVLLASEGGGDAGRQPAYA